MFNGILCAFLSLFLGFYLEERPATRRDAISEMKVMKFCISVFFLRITFSHFPICKDKNEKQIFPEMFPRIWLYFVCNNRILGEGQRVVPQHLCMLISMQTFVVQRADKIDNNKWRERALEVCPAPRSAVSSVYWFEWRRDRRPVWIRGLDCVQRTTILGKQLEKKKKSLVLISVKQDIYPLHITSRSIVRLFNQLLQGFHYSLVSL